MGTHFHVQPSTLHGLASRTAQRHEQVSQISSNIGGGGLHGSALGALGGSTASAISGSVSRASGAVGRGAQSLDQARGNLTSTAHQYEDVEQRTSESFNKIADPKQNTQTLHDGPTGTGHNGAGGGSGTKAAPPPKLPNSGGEQIRPNNIDTAQNAKPISKLPTCGDPIAVTTGFMVLSQEDVALPGRLPLVLTRSHLSSYRVGRWFGPTWASTVDVRLEVDADGVSFATEDGMLLSYPLPVAGGEPVLPVDGPRWPLSRDADGYLLVAPENDQVWRFAATDGAVLPVSAISNGVGDRIDFDYDPTGAPLAIRHSAGWHLDLHTEAGLVTAVHLRTGQEGGLALVRYRYDDQRRLVEVLNSSGQPLRFDYDQAGRITRWQDRNGAWYRYEYDGEGRCVRAEGTGGMLAYTFDYDREQRVTTVRDSFGQATVYEHNAAWQLVRQTDPRGGVTVQDWDRYDRLQSSTDPLGRTTRYEYDEVGNLTGITYPDGSRELAEYNERGRQTAAIGPDGATWRWEYLSTGELAAEIDPTGARTTFRYDPAGNLTDLTDPTGATTRLRTDQFGLPVELVDPLGATTSYQHDLLGRLRSMTDQVGGVTQLSWTIEGQPLTQRDPDGAVRQWRHDAEGNVRELVDEQGQVTRVETGPLDLPVAQVGPDGARLALGYDSELRVSTVTNELGQVWRYEYDAAGNLAAETDFAGHTQRYRHDAAGQLVESTNSAGQTVRMSYDALGRLVRRDADGAVSSYEYDPAGRLVRAVNADAELVFGYDPAGRLLTETVNGRTVTHGYDQVGRRVSRRTPTGAHSGWEFDARDLPTSLRTADRAFGFRHDAAGREVSRQLGAGVHLQRAYDGRHQLVNEALVAESPTGPRTVQQRGYRYRPDGYPVEVLDQLAGPRRYELDPVGRVTSVREPDREQRYTYDPAGNLAPTGQVRYQADPVGRTVLREVVAPNGQTRAWRYAWDAEGRLTGVTTPEGQRWHYHYDPLGRRIAKARLTEDGTVAERTDFTWDGPQLAEQVHNGTQATVWDWHPSVHLPLAQTDRVANGNGWVDQRSLAVLTDLVGAPTELVGADGSLAWRGRSSLWGVTGPAEAPRADTPLRFAGQYFDAETGLHYNLNRYYDPATARFVSPDPLGLAPGPNPLAYVVNPTVWFDPYGLAPCTYAQMHSNPPGPSLRLQGPRPPSLNPFSQPSRTRWPVTDAGRWNTITGGQTPVPTKHNIDDHPQYMTEMQRPAKNAIWNEIPGNQRMQPVAGTAVTGTQALQQLGQADPKTRPYWDAQNKRDQDLAQSAVTLHGQNPQRPPNTLDNIDHRLNEVPPNHANPKLDGTTRLLGDHQGVIIGGTHSGPSSPWAFLSQPQNMQGLHAAGVNKIYMEELRDDDHQALVNQYMHSPPGTPMNAGLEAHLRNTGGQDMVDTVTNAKAHGVDVQGIAGNPARRPAELAGDPAVHARVGMFNTYGSQVVQHDQADPNAGKWIMTAGKAHTVTHPGPAGGANWAGQNIPQNFPGLGDILNAPVVKHDPNGPGFVQVRPDESPTTQNPPAAAPQPAPAPAQPPGPVAPAPNPAAPAPAPGVQGP